MRWFFVLVLFAGLSAGCASGGHDRDRYSMDKSEADKEQLTDFRAPAPWELDQQIEEARHHHQ